MSGLLTRTELLFNFAIHT